MIEVKDNLDEILTVLSYDYATSGFKVENTKITEEYQNLNASKGWVDQVVKEYAKKCSTEDISVLINKDFDEVKFTIFPKNIGSSDLYSAMANYLIDYLQTV
jgi:hypothetical protein